MQIRPQSGIVSQMSCQGNSVTKIMQSMLHKNVAGPRRGSVVVMDQLSQADVRYLGVLVNHLAARITEGCLGVCTRQPEIPVSWS